MELEGQYYVDQMDVVVDPFTVVEMAQDLDFVEMEDLLDVVLQVKDADVD